MRRRKEENATRLDMTPMIDVTFLLIVFFLCTMDFKRIEGRFESNLPKGEGDSPTRVAELLEPLDVRVEPGTLHAGARAMPDLPALTTFVSSVVAGAPETRARIITGPGVSYGRVIDVVNACVAGGLRDIAFAR